jgi:hypothetical protein
VAVLVVLYPNLASFYLSSNDNSSFFQPSHVSYALNMLPEARERVEMKKKTSFDEI